MIHSIHSFVPSLRPVPYAYDPFVHATSRENSKYVAVTSHKIVHEPARGSEVLTLVQYEQQAEVEDEDETYEEER